MDLRVEIRHHDILLGLAARRPAGDLLFAPTRSDSGVGKLTDPSVPVLYRHLSESIELAFVARGEARIATPAEVFHMTPGKLLVIERGVYHAQLPAASALRHHVCWLHLRQKSASLVDSAYQSGSRAEFSYRLIELPGRTNVESIGAALASELAERRRGYPHAVGGLLAYLSCILIRRLPQARVTEPPTRESVALAGDTGVWRALETALEFCDANFRLGITRADVAKAVGYSPRYLSELISSHLGHSLSDHLRNLRMLDARRLLEQSDLSIHEIAIAVGYTHSSHFCRAFKQATGLSPRVYRGRLGVF